jgi:ABC-type transport system involved in multi-copper enzyme maturation permease subunit
MSANASESAAAEPARSARERGTWLDTRRLGILTRFELAEALRSRLVLVVLSVYGAGAALGSFLFVQALDAAERSLQSAMDAQLNAHVVPPEGVQRQAVQQVLSYLIDDAELLADLVEADPLALFYGFVALQLVTPLVLIISAGAHATDTSRGTTRFLLTRCERLTWALGKTLAHAALLALGLTLSALATAAVGFWQGHLSPASVPWLARAAGRALVYGLAHLGIFSGIALALPSPSSARAASVLVLMGCWLGHTLSQARWVVALLPGVQALGWIFPGHYQPLLWSPQWLVSGAAALALLGLGALGFAGGHLRFRGADA